MKTYTKSQFDVRMRRGDGFRSPEGETTASVWSTEEKGIVTVPCRVVEDSPYLDTWLKIGLANAWIREASDPPFTRECFAPAATVEELEELIRGNNWALGVAFYLGDICLINQSEGGSEFLVIKGNVDFESFSTTPMIKMGEFSDQIRAIQRATPEQCQRLQYGEEHPDPDKRMEALASNTLWGAHPSLLKHLCAILGKDPADKEIKACDVLPLLHEMPEAERLALL